MLSYDKLADNARRFKVLMGMSTGEFDLLLAKVEKAHPEAESGRLSKRPRKRAIGAGRRFALDLRNRVLLLPFHCRTYTTQDVAAEVFGVGQATVSRSIAGRAARQAVRPDTGQDPRQGQTGSRRHSNPLTIRKIPENRSILPYENSQYANW